LFFELSLLKSTNIVEILYATTIITVLFILSKAVSAN
jgi:hypothetical protein